MNLQRPRNARRLGRGIDLLAYPPPYRSWLALSNDPDCTTWERWQELHELIWQRLALPFADSFFLFSYNDATPGQVTVAEHPEILAAHAHDTMHTWGDYTMSRSRLFHRAEAEAGLALLREHGAAPRIWTDHSNFSGNILHRGDSGAWPRIEDASGHVYENFVYSLDLVRRAGVRYLWDGKGSQVLGQDREISRSAWYAPLHGKGPKGRLVALADALLKPLATRLRSTLFTYDADHGRQYYSHTFPDEQTFYLFRRYTHWGEADIDGFGEVIAPPVIDRLIEHQGSCVVYTHLGKQRAERPPCKAHIPPATTAALEHVAARFAEQRLMISSTSRLLDYLVLRDHAELCGDRLDFRADGIRFAGLTKSDLAGMEFGLRSAAAFPRTVTCDGEQIAYRLEEMAPGIRRLSFPNGLSFPEAGVETA